jgi:hypothetical protein
MDVLLKRREDGKKSQEARDKAKEHRHMATEKTKLKPADGVDVNYTSLDKHTADNYWIALAANALGVNVYDTDGHGHGESHGHGHVELMVGERISPEDYYAGNNHCLWTAMPESIVALNLSLALNKDVGENWFDYIKASLVCGLFPLIVTFLIEVSTVLALYRVNSDLEGNEEFCDQSQILQMSVVGIFLLTLLSPMQDIIKEASIGFSSTRCVMDVHEGSHLFIYGAGADAGVGKEFEEIGDKSLVVKEVRTCAPSFIVYWGSVILEFGVLMLTLWIGIHYTLSQSNASEIVQAAVAISFINEVDNMVFDAVVSEQLKDFLSKIEYEVPIMSGAGKTSFASAMYQMTLLMPALLIFTYYTVDYLRTNHCSGLHDPSME